MLVHVCVFSKRCAVAIWPLTRLKAVSVSVIKKLYSFFFVYVAYYMSINV